MKKYSLILSVFILHIAFTSCSNFWMYKSVNADLVNAVKQKTTIQTFEHLNEPIVIALPVYEQYYLFGNKNNDSKSERAGDIIAVIDIETDTVYDWVFFPGNHGWSIWRLVEAGANPTRYLMSSVGTKSIATLDPQKTTLTVTETGIAENLWNYKAYGTKVPLCYISYDSKTQLEDYHTLLFDCEINKLSERDLLVKTTNVTDIYWLRSSPDGNMWITYPSNDGTVHLQEFDIKKEEVLDTCCTFSNTSDSYKVCCVSDRYAFISYHTYDDNLTGAYLFDRQTKEKSKIAGIEEDGNIQYVYDVLNVKDSFYAIVPYQIDPDLPVGPNIYKIDVKSKTAQKEFYLPFDFTDNSYVRGDKIYFMNSRNSSDITYTYYDTVTKQQGNVVRVSAEQIINEYMGKK